MPFINLDISTARQILEKNNELLDLLLRDGKINPHEYDLLQVLREYAISHKSELKDKKREKLVKICSEYFSKEAERAIKLLTKFVEQKRSNVSWVLFSRTIQFIPFEEKNPLEGYKAILNEIYKTQITETLKPKSGG